MPIGNLEIVKYRFDVVKGDPKIIIEMIRVNDENGEFIKFAKMKDVVPYLAKFPVKFRELKND